jgi:hypothetical protein
MAKVEHFGAGDKILIKEYNMICAPNLVIPPYESITV